MSPRQTATHALALVERMEKNRLEPVDMMDVLVVCNAIVQTQIAARVRAAQQEREVQDE
jgi:hypothetical protein